MTDSGFSPIAAKLVLIASLGNEQRALCIAWGLHGELWGCCSYFARGQSPLWGDLKFAPTPGLSGGDSWWVPHPELPVGRTRAHSATAALAPKAKPSWERKGALLGKALLLLPALSQLWKKEQPSAARAVNVTFHECYACKGTCQV